MGAPGDWYGVVEECIKSVVLLAHCNETAYYLSPQSCLHTSASGALGEAAGRETTQERVTIFSDSQAAIRSMASDEPGPGQHYAL